MTMTKLRILAGVPAPSVPRDPDLTTVFEAPGLVIQASQVVSILRGPDGSVLIVAGDIVGRREASGEIRPLDAGLTELRSLADQGVRRVPRELEGRYVIVAARSDGSADVVTDRYAQVDVYLERVGNGTILASDLELLPFHGRTVAYDPAAFVHTMTVFAWRPPKRHTLYQGVSRLGVGQVVRIDPAGVRVEETPFEPAAAGAYGPRELEEYAEIFLEAVRARGSVHGNAVYLSSGWDSTALLACLVKIFGARKVRGVIGRMQYSAQSGVINQFEIDRAQAVAAYFKVPLEIVEFDYRTGGPALFEAVRPHLRRHHLFGLGALNHWKLAEHVARTTNGQEAVFAGEISDGVHNLGFSQFFTIFHPSLEFREYSDKMASYLFGPSFFSRFQRDGTTDDVIYHWLRDRCGNATFDAPAADGVSRARQILSSFFLRANRLPLWSVRNSRMLTPAGCDRYLSEMEATYLQTAAERVTPETWYSWIIHLYNSFHWQGSTVSTLAMTAAAHGLPMQLPFWDTRLHDFLSAMPESWGRGLDLNPTKYPLKWMLRNRIDYPMHLQVGPHSYLYDVNPRFSLAAETIYRSSLAPFLRESLSRRPYRTFLSPDTFDLRHIDSVVDRYLKADALEGAELNDLAFVSFVSAVGCYGDEQ
jgi:hypothetical protein